jgi:hypothetical protein
VLSFFFHLGWTAVAPVFDLAASLVADDRIAALFCSEVTAVALCFIFTPFRSVP